MPEARARSRASASSQAGGSPTPGMPGRRPSRSEAARSALWSRAIGGWWEVVRRRMSAGSEIRGIGRFAHQDPSFLARSSGAIRGDRRAGRRPRRSKARHRTGGDGSVATPFLSGTVGEIASGKSSNRPWVARRVARAFQAAVGLAFGSPERPTTPATEPAGRGGPAWKAPARPCVTLQGPPRSAAERRRLRA